MESDHHWDAGPWKNCQASQTPNNLHLELAAKILSPVSKGISD